MKTAPSVLTTHFCWLLLLLASFAAQANLQQMEQLYTAQEYNAAYQLGLQLIPQQAGNPDFDLLFGVSAQRANQPEQAIFAFERVLMHYSDLRHPKAQVARFELARTNFMLGRLSQAQSMFNQLLNTSPPPPDAAIKRINWHLAAIEARQAGRSVASSDAHTNFYLGFNLGSDSNPNSITHKNRLTGTLFEGSPDLDRPKVKSSSLHELYLGATRYQQQAANWGWFIGGRATLTDYHASHASTADNYTLNAQAGGIILGTNWRLTLPVQAYYLKRDDADKNAVTLFALAADFNQRLNANWEYNTFIQLANLGFSPSYGRDASNINLGALLTYKLNPQLKFYAGPVITQESADEDHLSYTSYALRTGAGYAITDQQYLDLSLSYTNASFDEGMLLFNNSKRDYNRTLASLSYKYRLPYNLLLDLGINYTNNSSDINMYTYNRTQISAGLRKEW